MVFVNENKNLVLSLPSFTAERHIHLLHSLVGCVYSTITCADLNPVAIDNASVVLTLISDMLPVVDED